MKFSSLKNILKILLSKLPGNKIGELYLTLSDGYSTKSYAQDGEDLIISSFFENRQQEAGYYVDIGAHHPKRFSNTFFFYKLGWRGINVDATPGSMNLFKRLRPHDINIEQAVSNEKQSKNYFIFNEPALNGFENDLTKQYIENEHYTLLKKIKLTTVPLSEILAQYLPEGQEISFLSVDVEGMDLNVLKSNDWDRYRPHYIIAELLSNIDAPKDNNEVTRFLFKKGYILCAQNRRNGIFFDTLNPGISA